MVIFFSSLNWTWSVYDDQKKKISEDVVTMERS